MAFEFYYPLLMGIMVAFLGACLGSFAGVIIYRWPLGKSIVTPRSFCGACEKTLKPWHNIPLISWLYLGGRCAYCHARFGLRLLVLELFFFMCAFALYQKTGLSITTLDKFGFCFLLICLAYIDLDTFYLPLSLLGALVVWGTLFSVVYYFYPSLYRAPSSPLSLLSSLLLTKQQAFSLSDRLWGALAGLGFFSLINALGSLILRRARRIGAHQWAMGWGDPVLLMAIGLSVGLSRLLLVIFIASFLGSLVGIALRLFDKMPLKVEGVTEGGVPYGPFLAIAAIYVYLF